MTAGSRYLEQPRRSLAEIERARIEPGNRARHELHGECRVVDVLRSHGTARIEFPSGGGIWVRLDQLEKLPDGGGER